MMRIGFILWNIISVGIDSYEIEIYLSRGLRLGFLALVLFFYPSIIRASENRVFLKKRGLQEIRNGLSLM